MADTSSKQDSEKADDPRVDALLTEAEEAGDQAARAVAENPAAGTQDVLESAEQSARTAATIASEAAQAVNSAADPAPSSAPGGTDPAQPAADSGSLTGKLGDLLASVSKTEERLDVVTSVVAPRPAPETRGASSGSTTVKATGRITPPSKPPNTVPAQAPVESAPAGESESIQSLDADLAALTESLLASDEPSEPPAPAETAAAPKPTVPAGPTPAETASTPSPSSSVGGTVPTASESKPAPATTPSAAPSKPSIGQAATVKTPDPNPTTVSGARAAWGAIEPTLLKVLSPLAIPMRGQPKLVRDVVGAVAVWTVVLALGLWGYVLFVFKPPPPRASQAEFEIATSSPHRDGNPPSEYADAAAKHAAENHAE